MNESRQLSSKCRRVFQETQTPTIRSSEVDMRKKKTDVEGFASRRTDLVQGFKGKSGHFLQCVRECVCVQVFCQMFLLVSHPSTSHSVSSSCWYQRCRRETRCSFWFHVGSLVPSRTQQRLHCVQLHAVPGSSVCSCVWESFAHSNYVMRAEPSGRVCGRAVDGSCRLKICWHVSSPSALLSVWCLVLAPRAGLCAQETRRTDIH